MRFLTTILIILTFFAISNNECQEIRDSDFKVDYDFFKITIVNQSNFPRLKIENIYLTNTEHDLFQWNAKLNSNTENYLEKNNPLTIIIENNFNRDSHNGNGTILVGRITSIRGRFFYKNLQKSWTSHPLIDTFEVLDMKIIPCDSNNIPLSKFSMVSIQLNINPDQSAIDNYIKSVGTIYDKIEFGMSKRQYKKAIGDSTTRTIGNYQYSFEPSFTDDNEIYSLKLNGDWLDSSYYYNELKTQVENFKAIMVQKYGAPFITNDYPKIDSVGHTSEWIYTWQMGNKLIRIGVTKNSSAKYCVVCWIYDENIYKEVVIQDGINNR